MHIFFEFREKLLSVIKAFLTEEGLGVTPAYERITMDPPKESSFGDIATNAVMILAQTLQLPPQTIFEKISPYLQKIEGVSEISFAKPGFINFRLKENMWHQVLGDILREGTDYGNSSLYAGNHINVEYVSVNPTGPMHAAHARGAVVGDVLAALLEKVGYHVTREFYINDSGTQADNLARSCYLRYLQALGKADITQVPEEYPGDYLKPIGEELALQEGDRWVDQPENAWLTPIRDFTIATMMELIKNDLKDLGIHHDVFSSESRLVEEGLVSEAYHILETSGLLYRGILTPPKGHTLEDWEPREQVLFKSTRFGDDIDRAMKKSDGSWTYFAKDVAYHYDKFKRGSPILIDVLGADHGGYVKRIQSAVTAITERKGSLKVILCQIVRLFEDGKAIKLSKRLGNLLYLSDMIQEMGKDVIRFYMLTRRNDMALDFDFTKAKEQTKDNPVFYVQYAYARTCSLKRQAKEIFPEIDLSTEALLRADFSQLRSPEELHLIKKLSDWPRQVLAAAQVCEPHRLAYYLHELASDFHTFWSLGREKLHLRFLDPNNMAITLPRLGLIVALQSVLVSGLRVLGVTPQEEM